MTTRRFKFDGIRLFATFPQCTRSKEDALEAIQRGVYPVDWAVVAHELHESGDHHLHILIQFRNRVHTVMPDCFDYIGGKHGNYQTVRSVRACAKYVSKSKDYVTFGIDVATLITGASGSKGVKHAECAALILGGTGVDGVLEWNPGFFMMNKRKIEDFISHVEITRARKRPKKWLLLDSSRQLAHVRTIVDWLNRNLCVTIRPFKQEQLYIYGPPGMGKTSLVDVLSQYCSIYHVPIDEEFYDDYNDDYDLAIIDEFKGQKTIQWLNLFLAGGTMNMRRKGVKPFLKHKNIPVIILSNFSVDEVYHKVAEIRRNSLKCRLFEVQVEEFIDVNFSKLLHDDLEEYIPLACEEPLAESPCGEDVPILIEDG